MILKGSRYEKTRSLDSGEGTRQACPGVRPRDIGPAQGVLEYQIQNGDRLDLLARQYYNNDRLWWRILDANPDLWLPNTLRLDGLAGTVILIPKAKE